MAKAEKTTVTREVTTTVEEDVYVITVTPDEAAVLRSLVGGCNHVFAPSREAQTSLWEGMRGLPTGYAVTNAITLTARDW